MLRLRMLACGTMRFVTSWLSFGSRNTECCEASFHRKRSERLAQDFTTDSVDDNVCAVTARDSTHAVSQLLQEVSMTSLNPSAFAVSALA